MTTPAQPAPDKITAEEIRQAHKQLNEKLDELNANLESLSQTVQRITEGIQIAATATQPMHTTDENPLEIVTMIKITRTRTNGKWYYKMLGGKYMKRGVTIWSEGLEALQLDPLKIEWKEDDSFTFEKPISATVQMKTYTDDSGEDKFTPQKVIGKA